MTRSMAPMVVDGNEIVVSGRFFKVARLRAEHYEWVDHPQSFVEKIQAEGRRIDVFTFLQRITSRDARYEFIRETESISVLALTTYDTWWKKQINDKTRNMVRRGGKAGVSIRVVEFSDELVKGIKAIYDESPIRQGKPFKHYQKDFETLKKDHMSFIDRSHFIGAFYQDELIGFVKLVNDSGVSHLMQIISKLSHHDKSPTNALIAKAVEMCAEQSIPYLHYGLWSKRGLGDFKKHHAFEKYDVPRYFLPLTWRGKLFLVLKLHRSLSSWLPESVLEILAKLRSRWYFFHYGSGRT